MKYNYIPDHVLSILLASELPHRLITFAVIPSCVYDYTTCMVYEFFNLFGGFNNSLSELLGWPMLRAWICSHLSSDIPQWIQSLHRYWWQTIIPIVHNRLYHSFPTLYLFSNHCKHFRPILILDRLLVSRSIIIFHLLGQLDHWLWLNGNYL